MGNGIPCETVGSSAMKKREEKLLEKNRVDGRLGGSVG